MYQIDQSHEYNDQVFEQILQHSQEHALANMLEFLQQDQPLIIQQQDQPSIIQQQAHQSSSIQGQQAQNQSQQHQHMYAQQQQHLPQASNSRDQCAIYHYHDYPGHTQQQQQQPQILNQLPRIQNFIKQNDYQASDFLNQQVYPQQNLFQTPLIKQKLNEETRQLKVFKRKIEDPDENELVKRAKFEIDRSSNTRLELLNEQITITIFSDSSKLKETNGTPALDKLNSKIREKKGKKNSKNDYDELFYCIENYWIELKNQKKNKMVPANVNFNMSPQI